MRFLLTRRFLTIALVALVVPGAWLIARDQGDEDTSVVARVKRGTFRVTVATSGELRARESVQITLPPGTQQAGAYQNKITTLVPEGTIVKEGDIVAQIDRSTLANKHQEVTLALTKAEAQYEQAMLDSTLNLSTARENIHTMDLGLEEKRLAKEQAVYEAPTIKRQAEIDYEKAERALAQARTDYQTKTEQAQAKMREVGADVERQRNLLKIVQTVMAGFTVRAPSPGMVIYVKEWNGRKRTAGSQVNSWEPSVATLPDLSQMESVTYVNEIDIRKIAVGQPVVITLDSDPSKQYTGTVTGVANVGEQRPNADSKVFEVKVKVAQPDTTLRPGMTTGNAIETYLAESALSVPIEALSNEDGVPFVFKQSGGNVAKQEVVTGAMSEDDVIIVQGLEEDDRVLLSPPQGHQGLSLARLPGSPRRPMTAGGDTAVGVPMSVPPRN
ncbi:MAG TPA: efflux RND transporter periplasmic adaptor subunit [Gemmatimonadales bacterium]